MNVVNFIFGLFHICNLPTLVVLMPPHLPDTPSANCTHLSADYTHLFIDYDNTFVDYIDFSTNYANKSDDCGNTLDDWVNIVVDSTNTHDNSSSKSYIPNPSLLWLLLTNLLFICRLKINSMFIIRSLICSSSTTFLIYFTIFIIIHCQNSTLEFHLHSIPNILAYVVLVFEL